MTPASVRRAVALLAALVAARAATLALRALAADGGGAAGVDSGPGAAWIGGMRDDIGVAAAVLAADAAVVLIAARVGRGRAPRAPRAADACLWAVYALLAAYTAFNVPVAAVLGTPLTAPMLAGAGGALADSVRVYLTAANAGACLAVLAVAGVAPALAAGAGRRWRGRRAAGAALALALGAVAIPSPGAVGPGGLADAATRNAIATLARTAWRQAGATRAALAGAAAGRAAPLDDGPEGDPAAADLRWLAGAAAGRDVVWIVLESTAAQYLAPYGAHEDPMPNVSALAARGIVFDHAYAVYPESIKGLYALLCAAEPAAYVDAAAYAARRRPCDSLAAVLGGAGYQTALFHSGRFVYLGMDEMVADRGFDSLVDAAAIGGAHASSFGVDEAATVARILAHVDRRDRARPYFVMYLPIAGHHPYESPGEGPRPFGESGDFRRYLSDLYRGDAAIGTLVAGLAARGLSERTLFVVSGDHGEAFHQHPGNFAHSLYLYDENVRVPLIVAAPGLTDARTGPGGGAAAPGSVRDGGAIRAPQVTSAIDIAPTILDALGIAAPAGHRGQSRLAPAAGVARFFTDHSAWLMGLRAGRWKLIRDVDGDHDLLFDLAADPAERHDVAATRPDLVARYRADLERWSRPR